jgi:hypothetical protein
VSEKRGSCHKDKIHLFVLNGITQVVFKPDLLDRSLMIQLERISDANRYTEDDLWKEFATLKPGILGAIFTAVSKALEKHPLIQLKEIPRMADFVKWGCAISEGLGYSQQEFIEAYSANTDKQVEAAVDANPIVSIIDEFMNKRYNSKFIGAPTELYQQLNRVAEELSLQNSPGWPKAANQLTRQIPNFEPALISLGITVRRFKGTDRKITIERTGEFNLANTKDDEDDAFSILIKENNK